MQEIRHNHIWVIVPDSLRMMMTIRNKWVQSIFSALLLVLMVTIWILFAPLQFGGQASFIIVAGASMEPNLHEGDLVIAHSAKDYEIGDVVTYKHPLAGPIIHRIVDRDGEQYILQGDNNEWLDTFYPTDKELIGKLWMYIPDAGKFIGRLRNPSIQIILATLIAIGVFATIKRDDTDRSLRSKKDKNKQRRTFPMSFKEGIEGTLFGLMVLLFTSGLLALASYTKPITMMVASDLPYKMSGKYEYSAQAPPGIYDAPFVQTGDPVFRKLTDEIDVIFTFEFISEDLSDVNGTIRLDLELSDSGGWKRTDELHPTVDFEGKSVEVDGKVVLSQYQALIETLEEQTGFERHEYTLRIIPAVLIKAKYQDGEYLATFDPNLVFRLDELQMFLVVTEPGGSRLDQLFQSHLDTFEYPEEKSNILSILGVDLSVKSARWLSSIGLLISVSGLIWFMVLYRYSSGDGKESQIAFRYGSILVDVKAGNFWDGNHRIEVDRIEDLGRFAEISGGVILHEAHGHHHNYYVHDRDVIYHYEMDVNVDIGSEIDERRPTPITPQERGDLIISSNSSSTNQHPEKIGPLGKMSEGPVNNKEEYQDRNLTRKLWKGKFEQAQSRITIPMMDWIQKVFRKDRDG